MTHSTTLQLFVLSGLLAACNIDTLAAEFHATEPPTGGTSGADTTEGAGSSSGSSTTDASGSMSGDGTTTTTMSSTGPADDTTTGAATTGETGDESTGPASVCGDAVVQGAEECDDPGDVHCFKCYRDRLVFVTSADVQGDWAKSSLDYWCNHLAGKAGLLVDNQARFKAWASTSEGSAAERLVHSPGRYVMVNDLVFAQSWDELIAGNILNALEVDENSQTRVAPVWTDTRPDGSAIVAADGDHCSDWTSDSSNSWAYLGQSSAVDGGWTLYEPDGPTNPTLCIAPAALYCFESP